MGGVSMKSGNLFTSGWLLDENNLELKNQFQMTNLTILSSGATLLIAIIINLIRETPGLIPLEIFLLSTNTILFLRLRYSKESLDSVSFTVTMQFTFFFLFLISVSEPNELKHVWLVTYPIILLYLQRLNYAIAWFILTLSILLFIPFQPFFDVAYSSYQIMYLIFALIAISLITYFYQLKMTEANSIILKQKTQLLDVNLELEQQVQELQAKDKMLTIQSKQAVMGEMISMIAHQWRQPLSTVTLQISNLQLKKMLGEDISSESTYEVLNEISDTIMYLSNTVDDFKTYFHPARKFDEISLEELLQRSMNFVLPRLKGSSIELPLEIVQDRQIKTYVNELVQVILNLLNNAIDILLQEKVIDAKVTLLAKVKQDMLFVIVEDNASGINLNNLPHIFEPYFSTKGKNGTGLGLYMSQMIIQKQFMGEIEVETSSKGSTFTIKVPLQDV
jgi:signal transduction histidine kinase